MKIHLEVLDDMGFVVQQQTFDSPMIVVGERRRADFFIEGFFVTEVIDGEIHSTRHVEIHSDGQRAVVRTQRSVRALTNPAEIKFGDRKLYISQYAEHEDGPGARGYCPKCLSSLVERQVGGAYRSMARRKRGCERCGALVIDLEDAAASIGSFSDARTTDWVHVQALERCPECAAPMMRRTLTTEHGSAEVERCKPCGVLVLDREDQLELLTP